MARFSVVLACVPLAGCKTLEAFLETLFQNGDSMAPVVIASCPTLKEYPREQMSRAADELAKLPKDSAVVPLVRDYKSLRAACRTK